MIIRLLNYNLSLMSYQQKKRLHIIDVGSKFTKISRVLLQRCTIAANKLIA